MSECSEIDKYTVQTSQDSSLHNSLKQLTLIVHGLVFEGLIIGKICFVWDLMGFYLEELIHVFGILQYYNIHKNKSWYLLINRSINQSINQSTNQPTNQSINQSINQNVTGLHTIQSLLQISSGMKPIQHSIDNYVLFCLCIHIKLDCFLCLHKTQSEGFENCHTHKH